MRPIFAILAAAMTVVWAGHAPAQDDLSFRDDFTGSKLAPEFRVVNPDPNRMALVDGDFLLLLTHEDYLNVVAYTGELPKEFEVSIDVQNHLLHQKQGVALGMTEGDNGIYAGLFFPSCCGLEYNFFFDKWLDGEVSSYKVDIPNGDISSPFSLKIESKGVEYAASYRLNNSSWIEIGTHVSVRPYSAPVFYAYSAPDVVYDPPESPIRIDSFELVDLAAR